MGKAKIYIKVAKKSSYNYSNPFKKYSVEGKNNPSNRPLYKNKSSYQEKALPTVAFALILDIPDEAFEQAERRSRKSIYQWTRSNS